RRGEVFEHILSYTENELRLVHNAYLEAYFQSSKKTLAELIRGEWIWTPGEYFSKVLANKNEILSRLRAIGAA
ncbi:MAG: hypothetical protein AAF242_20975, partial [Bacteroidota bacterium]